MSTFIQFIKKVLQLDLKKKNFVSPTDEFLTEIYKQHKLSVSQKKERAKMLRIFKLRDHKSDKEEHKKIWSNF